MLDVYSFNYSERRGLFPPKLPTKPNVQLLCVRLNFNYPLCLYSISQR